MSPQASEPSQAQWVLPQSIRTRRSWWKLARFIFLASLSAGVLFTTALDALINARIEKALQKYEARDQARAKVETQVPQRTWVLSYRDEQGFHTQLCESTRADGSGVHCVTTQSQ